MNKGKLDPDQPNNKQPNNKNKNYDLMMNLQLPFHSIPFIHSLTIFPKYKILLLMIFAFCFFVFAFCFLLFVWFLLLPFSLCFVAVVWFDFFFFFFDNNHDPHHRYQKKETIFVLFFVVVSMNKMNPFKGEIWLLWKIKKFFACLPAIENHYLFCFRHLRLGLGFLSFAYLLYAYWLFVWEINLIW